MSDFLWCNSILAGITGSLKEVDPTDSKGDGSNYALTAGCRAITTYDSKLIFYTLQESAGQSDDGINIVIPENNPGNFWWELFGYIAMPDFSIIPSGTELSNVNDPRPYIPDGFSLGSGDIDSYLKELVISTDPILTQKTATGIYGDYIYQLRNGIIHKWNLVTGAYTQVTDSSGLLNEYHCPNFVGDWLIELHGEPMDTIQRLNMSTETADSISTPTWPGPGTLEDKHGLATAVNMIPFDGKFILFGGTADVSGDDAVGCTIYDPVTNSWTPKTDMPIGEPGCCLIPNYTDRKVLILGGNGVTWPPIAYLYDVDGDSYASIDNGSGVGNFYSHWQDRGIYNDDLGLYMFFVRTAYDTQAWTASFSLVVYDPILDLWSDAKVWEDVPIGTFGLHIFDSTYGLIIPGYTGDMVDYDQGYDFGHFPADVILKWAKD